MTWEKVEDLKMEHCYIAPDYAAEARLFQVMSEPFLFFDHLRLMLRLFYREEPKKRKIKQGVGSYHGLPRQLRCLLQKKRSQGRQL